MEDVMTASASKRFILVIIGLVICPKIFITAEDVNHENKEQEFAKNSTNGERFYEQFYEWSVWSPCSRTCGIGIKFRGQLCLRENQALCKKRARIHATCNTQPCPQGRADFRDVQCGQYNDRDIFINGARAKWMSYVRGDNQCLLFCYPYGHDLFYYFGRARDGTQCSKEPYGVCIFGRCKPVGCDNKLESGVYMDKCRVCGGNSTSCKPVRGKVERSPTQFERRSGYAKLMVIPKGSTSVFLTDTTWNYLALRRQNGEYIVNGNRIVSWSGMFKVGDMEVKYKRLSNNVKETIQITGPTQEDLHVMSLLIAGKLNTTFEYWMPIGMEKVAADIPRGNLSPLQMSWGRWTVCSASCGGGIKVRARNGDVTTVSSFREKETEVKKCNTEPCDKMTAAWSEWAPWGDCSATCGGGAKIRFRYCKKPSSSSAKAGCAGKRYAVEQCNVEKCPEEETKPTTTTIQGRTTVGSSHKLQMDASVTRKRSKHASASSQKLKTSSEMSQTVTVSLYYSKTPNIPVHQSSQSRSFPSHGTITGSSLQGVKQTVSKVEEYSTSSALSMPLISSKLSLRHSTKESFESQEVSRRTQKVLPTFSSKSKRLEAKASDLKQKQSQSSLEETVNLTVSQLKQSSVVLIQGLGPSTAELAEVVHSTNIHATQATDTILSTVRPSPIVMDVFSTSRQFKLPTHSIQSATVLETNVRTHSDVVGVESVYDYEADKDSTESVSKSSLVPFITSEVSVAEDISTSKATTTLSLTDDLVHRETVISSATFQELVLDRMSTRYRVFDLTSHQRDRTNASSTVRYRLTSSDIDTDILPSSFSLGERPSVFTSSVVSTVDRTPNLMRSEFLSSVKPSVSSDYSLVFSSRIWRDAISGEAMILLRHGTTSLGMTSGENKTPRMDTLVQKGMKRISVYVYKSSAPFESDSMTPIKKPPSFLSWNQTTSTVKSVEPRTYSSFGSQASSDVTLTGLTSSVLKIKTGYSTFNPTPAVSEDSFLHLMTLPSHVVASESKGKSATKHTDSVTNTSSTLHLQSSLPTFKTTKLLSASLTTHIKSSLLVHSTLSAPSVTEGVYDYSTASSYPQLISQLDTEGLTDSSPTQGIRSLTFTFDPLKQSKTHLTRDLTPTLSAATLYRSSIVTQRGHPSLSTKTSPSLRSKLKDNGTSRSQHAITIVSSKSSMLSSMLTEKTSQLPLNRTVSEMNSSLPNDSILDTATPFPHFSSPEEVKGSLNSSLPAFLSRGMLTSVPSSEEFKRPKTYLHAEMYSSKSISSTQKTSSVTQSDHFLATSSPPPRPPFSALEVTEKTNFMDSSTSLSSRKHITSSVLVSSALDVKATTSHLDSLKRLSTKHLVVSPMSSQPTSTLQLQSSTSDINPLTSFASRQQMYSFTSSHISSALQKKEAPSSGDHLIYLLTGQSMPLSMAAQSTSTLNLEHLSTHMHSLRNTLPTQPAYLAPSRSFHSTLVVEDSISNMESLTTSLSRQSAPSSMPRHFMSSSSLEATTTPTPLFSSTVEVTGFLNFSTIELSSEHRMVSVSLHPSFAPKLKATASVMDYRTGPLTRDNMVSSLSGSTEHVNSTKIAKDSLRSLQSKYRVFPSSPGLRSKLLLEEIAGFMHALSSSSSSHKVLLSPSQAFSSPTIEETASNFMDSVRISSSQTVVPTISLAGSLSSSKWRQPLHLSSANEVEPTKSYMYPLTGSISMIDVMPSPSKPIISVLKLKRTKSRYNYVERSPLTKRTLLHSSVVNVKATKSLQKTTQGVDFMTRLEHLLTSSSLVKDMSKSLSLKSKENSSTIIDVSSTGLPSTQFKSSRVSLQLGVSVKAQTMKNSSLNSLPGSSSTPCELTLPSPQSTLALKQYATTSFSEILTITSSETRMSQDSSHVTSAEKANSTRIINKLSRSSSSKSMIASLSPMQVQSTSEVGVKGSLVDSTRTSPPTPQFNSASSKVSSGAFSTNRQLQSFVPPQLSSASEAHAQTTARRINSTTAPFSHGMPPFASIQASSAFEVNITSRMDSMRDSVKTSRFTHEIQLLPTTRLSSTHEVEITSLVDSSITPVPQDELQTLRHLQPSSAINGELKTSLKMGYLVSTSLKYEMTPKSTGPSLPTHVVKLMHSQLVSSLSRVDKTTTLTTFLPKRKTSSISPMQDNSSPNKMEVTTSLRTSISTYGIKPSPSLRASSLSREATETRSRLMDYIRTSPSEHEMPTLLPSQVSSVPKLEITTSFIDSIKHSSSKGEIAFLPPIQASSQVTEDSLKSLSLHDPIFELASATTTRDFTTSSPSSQRIISSLSPHYSSSVTGEATESLSYSLTAPLSRKQKVSSSFSHSSEVLKEEVATKVLHSLISSSSTQQTSLISSKFTSAIKAEATKSLRTSLARPSTSRQVLLTVSPTLQKSLNVEAIKTVFTSPASSSKEQKLSRISSPFSASMEDNTFSIVLASSTKSRSPSPQFRLSISVDSTRGSASFMQHIWSSASPQFSSAQKVESTAGHTEFPKSPLSEKSVLPSASPQSSSEINKEVTNSLMHSFTSSPPKRPILSSVLTVMTPGPSSTYEHLADEDTSPPPVSSIFKSTIIDLGGHSSSTSSSTSLQIESTMSNVNLPPASSERKSNTSFTKRVSSSTLHASKKKYQTVSTSVGTSRSMSSLSMESRALEIVTSSSQTASVSTLPTSTSVQEENETQCTPCDLSHRLKEKYCSSDYAIIIRVRSEALINGSQTSYTTKVRKFFKTNKPMKKKPDVRFNNGACSCKTELLMKKDYLLFGKHALWNGTIGILEVNRGGFLSEWEGSLEDKINQLEGYCSGSAMISTPLMSATVTLTSSTTSQLSKKETVTETVPLSTHSSMQLETPTSIAGSTQASTIEPSATTSAAEEKCHRCENLVKRTRAFCTSDFVIHVAILSEAINEFNHDTRYRVRLIQTFKLTSKVNTVRSVWILGNLCRCPLIVPGKQYLLMGRLGTLASSAEPIAEINRQSYVEEWKSSMMRRVPEIRKRCPVNATKMSTLITNNIKITTAPSTAETRTTELPTSAPTSKPPVNSKCRTCRITKKRNKSYCESDFVIQARILETSFNGTLQERKYRIRIIRVFKSAVDLKVRQNIFVVNDQCQCPKLDLRQQYVIMGTLEKVSITDTRLLIPARPYVWKWRSRMEEGLKSITCNN